MKSQVLSHYTFITPTAIAFVLFAVIFLSVFYVVYIKNNKSELEKYASMPLDQGADHE